MKEFLITLKQTEKVTRFGLFYCLGVCILGAVFGLFMSLSMMFAWKTRNHLGTLMIVMVMAIQVVACGLALFPACFQHALSLGKVRKHLFPAHYLLWIRNTLVVLLIALGVSLVEELVYSALLKDAIYLVDMITFLSNPLVFVTILLGVPALILFLGGIALCFGIKFMWAFPVVYVVVSGFSYYTKKHPDSAVVSWLDGLSSAEPNVALICLLCLLASAILLGLSWLMLSKQRVIF